MNAYLLLTLKNDKSGQPLGAQNPRILFVYGDDFCILLGYNSLRFLAEFVDDEEISKAIELVID